MVDKLILYIVNLGLLTRCGTNSLCDLYLIPSFMQCCFTLDPHFGISNPFSSLCSSPQMQMLI